MSKKTAIFSGEKVWTAKNRDGKYCVPWLCKIGTCVNFVCVKLGLVLFCGGVYLGVCKIGLCKFEVVKIGVRVNLGPV